MESIYPGRTAWFILLLLLIINSQIVAQGVSDNIFDYTYLSAVKQYAKPQWIIPGIDHFRQKATEKKSVSKAFFYSLLLPGAGEAYVGRSTYTKLFVSLEMVGWGIYIANRIRVNSHEQDYKNFAIQHAGVSGTEKEKQYWIDIGKYDNIYEHNEQRRRERDVEAIYAENAINYWRWDTYANRIFYDGQRIETREIERKEVFIIGGIVLNHLLSAINALRLAKAYNKGSEQLGWNFNVRLDPTHTNLSFSFTTLF